VVWIFSFILFFSDLCVVLKCKREGAKKKDVQQIVSKQIHCRVQPVCHCSLISLPLITTSQYLLDQTWERERGMCWSVCRVRQGSMLAFCKRGSPYKSYWFRFPKQRLSHVFLWLYLYWLGLGFSFRDLVRKFLQHSLIWQTLPSRRRWWSA